MGTFTSFYLETNKIELVIQTIQEISGCKLNADCKFSDKKLQSFDSIPTYFAISQFNKNWVIVIHNGLDFLEDWGTNLSEKFHATAIFTMVQSTSDTYYFSVYQDGLKIREIARSDGSEEAIINEGTPFNFENKSTDILLDSEIIEDYCENLGIVKESGDASNTSWTILEKEVEVKPKLWWKFW